MFTMLGRLWLLGFAGGALLGVLIVAATKVG